MSARQVVSVELCAACLDRLTWDGDLRRCFSPRCRLFRVDQAAADFLMRESERMVRGEIVTPHITQTLAKRMAAAYLAVLAVSVSAPDSSESPGVRQAEAELEQLRAAVASVREMDGYDLKVSWACGGMGCEERGQMQPCGPYGDYVLRSDVLALIAGAGVRDAEATTA